MWLKKLFGRGFKTGGYVDDLSHHGIDLSDHYRSPLTLDPEDDGKVRIVSDGTAWGTKVFIGGKEVGGIVSIEFGDIRVNTVVSAKLEFMAVELDVAADIGLMEVVVDGLSEMRPVQSVDTLVGIDGTEHAGMKRPMLNHGEHAIYYLDGSPPTIISEPQ